jgi:site-specific DNA-methyltransferase (cytosine-N4-specific)
MSRSKKAYQTKLGTFYQGKIEDMLLSKTFQSYKGKVNLIFTSPPFPLNRKKKYGNFTGKEYIKWLSNITTELGEYLTADGSFVIEIGNSWESHQPIMSTLPIETLLKIKKSGSYNLCQQFVWFNTAKLPSPAQWVNIERTRVKDSFTHFWWLSKSNSPKANNRNILEEYSDSMKRLLKSKKYNAGGRPSEHNIGEKSFLTNNGGAIPSNVLIGANTSSRSDYLAYCNEQEITPHPARMPDFIVEYFVNFLTDKDDLVLDPFAGSNTTGSVAERLKRKWLSIEANEDYIKGSKSKFPYAKTTR